MKFTRPAVLLFALLVSACSSSSSTPPTNPSTPSTSAPTGSESFSGTIVVQGSLFFTFTISQAGTVTATLSSVSSTTITPDPNIALGVGLGAVSADGTTCNVANSTTTTAGLTSQLTSQGVSGTGCVLISDVGQLVAPVTIVVRVAHS